MAVIHGIDMQHFSQCEVLTATYQIDTSHLTPLITFITSLIMSSTNINLSNNSVLLYPGRST